MVAEPSAHRRLNRSWHVLGHLGAAPHILGQAYNGISETVCAGWVPLTLWALLRNMKIQVRGTAFSLGFLPEFVY